jgi:hypothetical protein
MMLAARMVACSTGPPRSDLLDSDQRGSSLSSDV